MEIRTDRTFGEPKEVMNSLVALSRDKFKTLHEQVGCFLDYLQSSSKEDPISVLERGINLWLNDSNCRYTGKITFHARR